MAVKKWLAIMICFAFILTTACSSGNSGNSGNDGTTNSGSNANNSTSGNTDPKPADSEKEAKDPLSDMSKQLEISWLGMLGRGKIEDNNKVQKHLEEKFNVKLVNKRVDVNNKEQRNLMVASGELPDYTYYLDDVYKLYTDGLTRSIPKAMIEKYAPNYAKILDSLGTGWKINRVPGKEGEYYALAGHIDTLDTLYWTQSYRLDWLEKAGIKPKGELIPVGTEGGLERIFFSKEAFTIAEETEIYTAFAKRDPDGDGQNNTYGLLLNNDNAPFTQATTAGAFGVGWNQYMEEDGKLKFYAISNAYKKYLQQMADWHKAGLFDPEFTTLNQAKSWEKYGTGTYGGAQALYFSAAMVGYTHNRPVANVILADPDAKILVTPPPIGPDGHQGAPAYGVGVDSLGYPAAIRADVTDEELARILMIFDYVNTDKEGYVFTMFGEEGVDFDWEGEPYKSAPINQKPEPERETKGIGYYNHVVRPASVTHYWNDRNSLKLLDLFFGTPDARAMMTRSFRYDYFNETKFAELNAKYNAMLKTISDEYLFKAITNEIDIDATWDAYVDSYLKNGGQELITELEKAPKMSELRGE